MSTSERVRRCLVSLTLCLLTGLLLPALTWTVVARAAVPAAAERRPAVVAQVLFVGDPTQPGRVRVQAAPTGVTADVVVAPAVAPDVVPGAVPVLLRLPGGGAAVLGVDRAELALGLGGVLALTGAVVAGGGWRVHRPTRLRAA